MTLAERLATVFGIGRAPIAPGTVASFVAVLLAWPLAWWGGRFAILVAGIVVGAIGAWACEHYEAAKGETDPSECVIDEVSGQWIALAFAPVSLLGFSLAFILFRVFDIAKPWPISWLEKLHGGVGIMADDWGAGLAAGIVIAVLAHAGII